MRTKVLPLVLLALVGIIGLSGVSHAGGVQGAYGPPLDETLIAMKEHGVW